MTVASEPALPDKPQKLPFNLQDGESVILFTRRHWLYLWPKIGAYVLSGILPAGVLVWLATATSGLGSTFGKVALIAAIVWLLFWAVRSYFTWYAFEHDVWVVTNQRIIDGVRPNWFHNRLSSADLVDVEDIAVSKSGILQTMFDFGELRCQTAAERPNFILGGIPWPEAVLGIVDKARHAARQQFGRAPP